MTKPRVLFVDDNSNILSAFKRQLRKNYNVYTAEGGAEALKLIDREPEFAVIVTDMQMPEMDGIELLSKVVTKSPNTVRLMLTGNADQETAINAVNEGNVFRFLTKPCAVKTLMQAVDAALEQYRLITAEKELLEKTLNGSIKMMTDVLSIVAPDIFGRVLALRETAVEVARALHMMDTWHLEIATVLSQVAYIALPVETLNRIKQNKKLSDVEDNVIRELPSLSSTLLINIPRLEKVAYIIAHQNDEYEGPGYVDGVEEESPIPVESRILKALYDMSDLVEQGQKHAEATEHLMKNPQGYDPKVLEIVNWFFSMTGAIEEIEVGVPIKVHELKAGDVLIQEAATYDGRVLVTPGHKVSQILVESLRNFHLLNAIKEPLMIKPQEDEAEE